MPALDRPDRRGKQILSRADLEALPQVKVRASEPGSLRVDFEGVTLKSVLEKAGVTFGEWMKGKRLTHCLLVEAADPYRAVIALPELDPAFTDRQTVLGSRRDESSWVKKKGHTGSSFLTRKEWLVGSGNVAALNIVDVQ